MTVQHRVNGALGGRVNIRVFTDEFVANLGGSPGRILLFEGQNLPFDLEGQFVGVRMGRLERSTRPSTPESL